ncbi:MAG: adenylate kinase family protein, partial [Actinomycetes bacterium]
MRVLLIGPPGAGKGTQATRIADHFDLARIATGDLLREEVANGTELGKVAEEYMDRGDLVPDDIVIQMTRDRMLEA